MIKGWEKLVKCPSNNHISGSGEESLSTRNTQRPYKADIIRILSLAYVCVYR